MSLIFTDELKESILECNPYYLYYLYAAHQAPLLMWRSRQEYWSGLPFPSPGDLPNPGIEPASLMSSALQVDSLPLSHWGETVGTMSEFIFWGSKITADGDYSHEIKRRLLLGRKVMANLEQRHYFANKGLSSQGYGFSSGHVWM